MSYNNKYSNKPFESASKTNHTSIINDKDVKNVPKQSLAITFIVVVNDCFF